MSDLPRMAKLCAGVYERKRGSTAHPLFWVNTTVFDYKARLKWRDTYHMWPYSQVWENWVILSLN